MTPVEVITPLLLRRGADLWEYHNAEQLARQIVRELVGHGFIEYEARVDTVLEFVQRIKHQGPCGMCGHPYAAHRTVDAIRERMRAGEPAEAVAEDYGFTAQGLGRYLEAFDTLEAQG